MAERSKQSRKRGRSVSEGIAHVSATFNNTLITITDKAGNALMQLSSGACGFRGARKSTPFAAQTAAEELSKRAREAFGLEKIEVWVRGPGPGRDSAIRGLRANVSINKIIDTTGLPHNGCRPPKKRRV